MGRRRTILILLGLSIVLMAVSTQAMPVSYVFRVTATTGPLAGVSARGTFTFDNSIIPSGGGTLDQINLLSYLNFTWHGIFYDQTTANTGGLAFDESGNLSSFGFGNQHGDGWVGIGIDTKDWLVSSHSGFRYASPGTGDFWGGTVTIERAGPVSEDFDGDRKTDMAFYRSSTGAWWIIPSSGIGPQGQVGAYGIGWGGSGFKPVPGDYDGDGKTDIAIYDTTGGAWWIIPSSGIGPQGQVGAYGVGWGGSAFKPVPGDYDGDGKTDVAIYDTTGGAWWIIPSSGIGPQGQVGAYGVGWGGSAFKPVPGDYDGDGKTDVAIYDTTGGAWWIIPSSGIGPQGQVGAYGVGWGGSVYNPVPGDYDGDGKTDIALYRSYTDNWWIIPSSGIGPQGQVGPYSVDRGGEGFKPVPGDYDGDGKTDVAYYGNIDGSWRVVYSSDGRYNVMCWSWGGDVSDIPLTTNPD